jgi:4-oxalocrotonate tautomerase
MPFIQVKISGERDVALASRVAQRVTALTGKHLRKDPALTAVAVEFIAPELWFIANTPLAVQRARSFHLHVSITDETNTKDEKSAYIAAIYAAMDGLLGRIHEKSYVHVADVRAAGYGYGGVTQEQRYVLGRTNQASVEPHRVAA